MIQKADFSKLTNVFVFNSETFFYCCKNVHIGEYYLIQLKTTFLIAFYIYRDKFLVLITLVR